MEGQGERDWTFCEYCLVVFYIVMETAEAPYIFWRLLDGLWI